MGESARLAREGGGGQRECTESGGQSGLRKKKRRLREL